MQGLGTNHATKTAQVSSLGAVPAAAASAAVDLSRDSHPFARYVEVTGLRVSSDSQNRLQLLYIVVNHSSMPLSALVLHVTVSSSALVTKGPLFKVSAIVPVLEPYESKEIRTDLDTQLHAGDIPDWDSLKADVQVTTH